MPAQSFVDLLGGAAVFLMASLFVGAALLIAFLSLRRAVDILRSESVPIGDVGTGVVTLEGRVEADETVTAPSGTECVAYSATAHPKFGNDSGTGPSVRRHVPFYVADDTGRVLVDPLRRGSGLEPAGTVLDRILGNDPSARDSIINGFDIHDSLSAAQTGDISFETTEAAVTHARLREELGDRTTIDIPGVEGMSPEERRYEIRENHLAPGDRVSVMGEAVASSPHHDSSPVVVHRGGKPFHVGSGSAEMSAGRQVAIGLVAGGIGAFGALILGFVLWGFLADVGVV